MRLSRVPFSRSGASCLIRSSADCTTNTQESEFSVHTRRLRSMGIRDKPISAGSPWQNCFAERLIGSIRRECVDHLVVFGEQHLRRALRSYARYYNEARTHRSLNKDAPVSRPIQPIGRIVSYTLVGGLHHQYARI